MPLSRKDARQVLADNKAMAILFGLMYRFAEVQTFCVTFLTQMADVFKIRKEAEAK
jgi:hypothetical protein